MVEFLSQNHQAIYEVVTTLIGICFVLFWSHRYTNTRIDKLDEKLTNILYAQGERLARIEGMLSNKDCCMIKDPRVNEKVN